MLFIDLSRTHDTTALACDSIMSGFITKVLTHGKEEAGSRRIEKLGARAENTKAGF